MEARWAGGPEDGVRFPRTPTGGTLAVKVCRTGMVDERRRYIP
jgi:hypothetical protein